MFLQSPVQRRSCQPQLGSRLCDVSIVFLQHLANQQFFYLVKIKLIQVQGLLSFFAGRSIKIKIFWLQYLTVGEDYGTLNGMLKLTDISRPGMFTHAGHGAVTDLRYALMILLSIMP